MNTTKLQVPINKAIREGLEKRARKLGFDSAQAYIRVWAQAEVEGRKLDFDSTDITLSPQAEKRYAKMITDLDEEKNSGKAVTFTTADEFMKDL